MERFGFIVIPRPKLRHKHEFKRDPCGYEVCECGKEMVTCTECGFYNIGTREENEEELEWHMALTRHMVGD